MRLINGVFMGGGAKSIAYAGALKATHDRDLWFGGVAGASAGAIVASLIAAGMQPEALENAIPDGLSAVQSNKFVRLGKAIVGNATSVFEGRGLRDWLDRTLADQIGATGERPVTFADLHRSTGIELYVVAMDLANGLPVVFCRRTTPNVEVAGAVAASAAIPGAFPAGRAVFDARGEGAVVHQLVDGSSWANYPAFIFQDRSFRTWLLGEAQLEGAWSDEDRADWIAEGERPTVGFILGDPEPLEQRNSIGFVPLDGPDVNRRFDQGPTYTSPKRVTYLFGALLSSDWARLVVGIALLIWLTLSVVVLPVASRRFSTWLALWMPDFLYPIALVGALAVVVVAMLVAIVVFGGLILVGRLIADTLLPSVKAVLGVPLEVAPWIGLGDDSIVIRVPDDALSTINFDVGPGVRAAAIDAAHDGASRQLDSEVVRGRLEALFTGSTPAPELYRRGRRTVQVSRVSDHASIAEVAALVAVACLLGGLAWWATNTVGADDIGRIVIAVFLSVIAVGAAVWYVGGRSARRAAARAALGVGVLPQRPERTSALVFLAGLALVVGGAVLSVAAMDHRSGDTFEAQVVRASESAADADINLYEMRLDGADDIVILESTRHLRLGEQVFVQLDEGGGAPTLVGALDDARFAVAVVFWLLGLGLITSGVRSYRWAVRCRRLDTLVADWNPS